MDIIKFPKQYKPLPEGYRVIYSKENEHYYGLAPNEDESVAHCSKYWCRNWCFAHYEKLITKDDLDAYEWIVS